MIRTLRYLLRILILALWRPPAGSRLRWHLRLRPARYWAAVVVEMEHAEAVVVFEEDDPLDLMLRWLDREVELVARQEMAEWVAAMGRG